MFLHLFWELLPAEGSVCKDSLFAREGVIPSGREGDSWGDRAELAGGETPAWVEQGSGKAPQNPARRPGSITK